MVSYSALFGTETSHPIPNAPVGHRQPSMADVVGSKPIGASNATERVRLPRAGRVYRDTEDDYTQGYAQIATFDQFHKVAPLTTR